MALRFQVPPHESGMPYTSIGLGSHSHEVGPDGYFYCDECAALAAQLGWPVEAAPDRGASLTPPEDIPATPKRKR